MFDAEGPGAVVRIWIGGAYNDNGILRFYLDDSDIAAIDGEVLSLISGHFRRCAYIYVCISFDSL